MDKIFKIKRNEIEVYPSDIFTEGFNKPSWGQRLNRPAHLIFKSCFPKDVPFNLEERIERIKSICDTDGYLYTGYNIEDNSFTIKTFGF